MRLLRTFAPVAFVCALVLGATERSMPPAAARAVGASDPLMDSVWYSGENVGYTYAPQMSRSAGLRSAEAEDAAAVSTFQVTYDANFNANPSAKAAFQAAVDNWARVVTSPGTIPIKVNANLQDLGVSGLLGYAGPTATCLSPAGLPNTRYPAALANVLNNNTACENAGAQITANLNSTFLAWDYGTTAAVANKVNFMTVAMHELGHGLGFNGTMDSAAGIGSFGYGSTQPVFVAPYDRFAVTGSGTPLLGFANPSAALHAQLVSGDTFFDGTTAIANNGGIRPKLETTHIPGGDNGFVRGSSFSHVDDTFYTGTPDGLMTYSTGSEELYADPGPIARGILKDIGWQIAGCAYSLSPARATAPAAGGAATAALTTQTGCAWTAASGDAAIATITSAASGVGSATISYTVAPNVSPWNRVVTLTIGASPYVVTQTGSDATLSADKSSLSIMAVSNGARFTAQTPPQTVRLVKSGSGIVTWTAASSQPWLIVSPTSGSGSATLTITSAFVSGLSSTQIGFIDIAVTGTRQALIPISVRLNTRLPTATAAPVGSFDTPADNSTGVTGSIAVTGWAMDEVGVTGVRIMRAPIAGEAATTTVGTRPLVFIGDAVLVDGARPDITAMFLGYPRNTFAGWGYLMLTNFLPNLGNGTFVLYAVADDADGKSTILGSKTITCTNANIQAPFGAIDTPAQGATVSGSLNNFGWVLVPGPQRADPPGGGTVRIVIDGAFIATVPSGWTNRSDLSALFTAAAYPGITTALGVATLDTTRLTNGVHTISWIVTDNDNRASGIGSRYFTVSNGSLIFDPSSLSSARSSNVVSNPASLSMRRAAALRIGGSHMLATEVAAAAAVSSAVRGRRGYDINAPLRTYSARGGVTTLQSEELDRIELRLGQTGRSHSGYLRTSTGLAPLPIGSALDETTGLFTWQPGVGFVGAYDLVFVEWANGRAVTKQDVRIVLNAKGSGWVGPQTVIDIADGDLVAGWAADLDSAVDTGVDTVHVWAYPVAGSGHGEPIFLGAAAYGGKRPDVAAVHGDRFEKSGYGIRVKGLEPATYDLAVFAYSTVRRGFVPAKTVRMVIR